MMNQLHRFSTYLILLVIFSTGTEALCQSEDIDTSYWNIDLKNVVVTAQYAPTSSKNAVHEVKVLKAEELKAKGYNSIDEALRNQLNMRINSDPVLGNGLEIQGMSGQHIKVLVDGVPVIGRLNGNIDLSQIQLSNVERIEIVEGALSSNYGSNASGGVINIITKKSIEKSISIEAESQVESVGIWRNQLNLAGSYKGFTVRLGTNFYNSQFAPIDSLRQFEEVKTPTGETQRVRKIPWNPKDQFGSHASLHYHFSDSFKVSYNYRYFDEEVNRYGEIRRPEFMPYAFNEKFSTGRRDHNLRLESYLSDKLYLKSITSFNRYNRLSEKIREDFDEDKLTSLEDERDTSIFNSVLHRSIISYLSDREINGLLGMEYQREGGIGDRIVDSTSNQTNKTSLTNLAFWSSVRYTGIENLKAQASLRYGYNSDFDHPLIPSVHLSWDFMNTWNIKLSYAHGYRAPALKELHYRFIDVNHYIIGNSDLNAENSRNLSAILSYSREFAGKNEIDLKGKFFYNEIENSIVLAQYEQLKYRYENISEFESQGVNFTAEYQWRENLEIMSGIGYTRSLNDFADETDNRYVNQLELQNSASYHFSNPNLTLYASHKFVGNQQYYYLDSDDNVQQGLIGSYNYLDASVKYAFWESRLSVTTGVKNILDVTSVPITGTSQSVHSSSASQRTLNWGRSYFIKLGVSLDY